MASSTVVTSVSACSLDNDDVWLEEDREMNGESPPTLTSTPPTKPISFSFHGARIPDGTNLWDFYNPIPTRITRPTMANDNDEEEEEAQNNDNTDNTTDNWTTFCDKVDTILAPVNQSRRWVFGMTFLSILCAMVILVSLFLALFLEKDDYQLEHNDTTTTYRMDTILCVLFGFAILPMVLLWITKYIIPSRIQTMRMEMEKLCRREQRRRSQRTRQQQGGGGGSTIKIQFTENEDKGYHIDVTVVVVAVVTTPTWAAATTTTTIVSSVDASGSVTTQEV